MRHSKAIYTGLGAMVGLALMTLQPAGVHAAVPTTVAVDGVLSSTGGPAADGLYDMTFAIYNVQSGGSAAWTEGSVKVPVFSGRYRHVLGASKPLTPTLMANLNKAWLGIKLGVEAELPRVQLQSVPFTVLAAAASKLQCTGCVGSAQLANGSIAATKVAFTYAAAKTKGGPAINALDLQCTGCVSVNEMSFNQDVDLGGNALKAAKVVAKDVAAGTVNAATFIGDGSKLSGIKIPSGTCSKPGEVVKGINPDGTLQCVSGMDPSALPKDGIDEISNDLIHNQFVDQTCGKTNVPIPDNNPVGVADTLTFPNVGLAQKLVVHLELTNSDLSSVTVKLFDPDNKPYLLYDKGGKGTKMDVSYPDKAKPVQGDLGVWTNKNPKGKWRIVVTDGKFLNNQMDGMIKKWCVGIQTLSNKKVQIKGNLIVDGNITSPGGVNIQGSVKLGEDKSQCTTSKKGTLRLSGSVVEVCVGNGWVPISTPVAFPDSKLVTPADGRRINTWIGNPDTVWTLCYRRSTHGASASTFHSKCNKKGDTVTIAKLDNGRLIGGYAGCAWQSKNNYGYSCSGSFLFNLTNGHAYHKKNYHNGNSNSFSHNYWIYDHSNYGPTWGGGHDWYVSKNMTTGYCNLGHTYGCRQIKSSTNGYSGYKDGACHKEWCGSYSSWKITELEVWYKNKF